MKNKILHLVLTIFSLAVFCIIALLFMGCLVEYIANPYVRAEEDDLDAEEKGAREDKEQEAKKEEKQTEVEQEAPAEEPAEEIAEEAKKPNPGIPNEPITYSGNLYNANGTEVILIVNFKTTEVTGPISLDSADDYIDATINGKIDIDTFEVTSNYYGIWRLKETDEEFPFNGTITGKITEDLSTFNGIIHPDDSDVGVEFTATK